MIVTSVAVVRIFFSTKLIQLHNQKKIISNKVNCYFEHPLRNYIFILSCWFTLVLTMSLHYPTNL